MMQRIALLALAAAMVLGGVWWMSRSVPDTSRPAPPAPTAPPPHAAPEVGKPAQGMPWVAAPGRVEPLSGEIRLGFGMAGNIRELPVEEGDRIHQGQELARLPSGAPEALVAAAEQALAAREAASAKAIAGARDMERQEARAAVDEAKARLAEARAMAEKGVIRSPIDGTVLRKHHQAGESVSFGTPVVTVGDVSRLRVRADVNERDIDRVAVGQKAILRGKPYGDRRFLGHVSRVAGILSPKNLGDDTPAEKNDTHTLETLVDVDEPAQLPVGLPMDVFIITTPGGENSLPASRP